MLSKDVRQKTLSDRKQILSKLCWQIMQLEFERNLLNNLVYLLNFFLFLMLISYFFTFLLLHFFLKYASWVTLMEIKAYMLIYILYIYEMVNIYLYKTYIYIIYTYLLYLFFLSSLYIYIYIYIYII